MEYIKVWKYNNNRLLGNRVFYSMDEANSYIRAFFYCKKGNRHVVINNTIVTKEEWIKLNK